MYRVLTDTLVQQQPTDAFPKRDKWIRFTFCQEFELETGWDLQTDGGSITLPKRIYAADNHGNIYALGGNNQNIGGFDSNDPIFLRGDKISIQWGYGFNDILGHEVAPMKTIFEGYISLVTSDSPFTLEVEDNMWKLKQVQAVGYNGRKFFPQKTYSIEQMMREFIDSAGLSFSVNDLTETTAGDMIIGNETIADVLARLKRDYNFKSYFRGDELRIGSKVYIDEDLIDPVTKKPRKPSKFIFNRNIIDDDLEYQRKDDIEMSTVAKTTDEELTGETTKDGHAKTKKVKVEVLITFKKGSDIPTYFVGSKENPIPPNLGGNRYTDTFPRGTSVELLKKLGTENLRLRYYTGFKGKLTAFGMPYVFFGENVDIMDEKLPERNGRYKVKSVRYSGGTSGLRQEIELDYLIASLDKKGNVIQKFH